MTTPRTVVPPIKCQGIKTKLVPWIRSVLPPEFDGGSVEHPLLVPPKVDVPDSRAAWIEPFMGSGVVAFNIRPKRAILSDSNPHIIHFYNAISQKKITARSARRFLWKEGQELSRSNGEHYYHIRERFNMHGDPIDFLFLNRSCFNGLIRFNHNGEFNVPFCRKPDRFSPAYITKIANQIQAVSDIIDAADYQFLCQDFSTAIHAAEPADIIYCDPPYIGRHADYFNGWNETQEKRLADLLTTVSCKFILSTWHSNAYRNNPFIHTLWSSFHVQTRPHFYHLGASEDNRNPILEALVTNFAPAPVESHRESGKQPDLRASERREPTLATARHHQAARHRSRRATVATLPSSTTMM